MEPLPKADDALKHLTEISRDVRAAVLLDKRGKLVASEGDPSDADRMAELGAELLEQARAASPGTPPAQLEVAVQGGAVYAATDSRFTIVAVAGRDALSSLMFYDLRSALARLGERRAA
jgi:hypothetical protein